MEIMNKQFSDPATTGSASPHDAFYKYYEQESLKSATLARFAATQSAVVRAARYFEIGPPPWQVADVGCGAATQCAIWAQQGHHVNGVDINEGLIELGKRRAAAAQLAMSLSAGSATALPWQDASMDICLCPELLEHVGDWEAVIKELIRVMKPGGILYLSTTNRLCPIQEEFDLPGYSWYPQALKRRYERLAVTTRPELVSHATYPAVHWFTYFGLRKYLLPHGFRCLDRFDVAALSSRGVLAASVLKAVRNCYPIRWAAHVATPYTMIFAQKPPAGSVSAMHGS
jgi:ubiquinone/menaquinone biosynthesis C-methylase UbiE